MNQLGELLRIPDFRRLWLAQIGADFGDSLTIMSLMILIQRLTGSTMSLAWLMISMTLPALVFSLISGVYVDRLDRRRMMIVSDLVRAGMVLGFLLIQTASMVPLIYVIAFIQAGIATLFNPARAAMLPRIVGEARLLAANSVAQMSRIVFGALGTATAGVLAGLASTQAPAFVFNAAMFALSALLVSRIGTSGAPEARETSRPWEDMRSGFGVIARSRSLCGVLLAAGVAMLGLGAVNVLMVPLVLGELAISEVYLGLIEGGQVVGVLIAGSLIAALAARLQPRSLVSLGLIGLGAAVATLYWADQMWQLTLILLLVGIAIVPTQAGVNTLSLTLVRDAMRGRVAGAVTAAVSTATIVSMGLAGVLAATIGIRNVFVISGCLTIAAGLLAWAMIEPRRSITATAEAVLSP